MGSLLFDLIIYPLWLIIELVYVVFDLMFHNPFLSIAGVSIAVNILTLPLYNIAEAWQQKERDIQKKMKPQVDRIKAVFKGDEQYMILSTYYRQQHYHPIYGMRSSISLLIQVPFFIAAYSFLSNLEPLKGARFFFIKDLGAPDGLLTLGNYTFNILPVLMTLINIVSGAIYTKGFPLKEKIQLYGMAGLFLILLYNSPSGLVIYWTLNNVFSLFKNIVNKTPKPGKVLYVLASVCAVLMIVFLLFFHHARIIKRLFLSAVLAVIPLLPLLAKAFRVILKKPVEYLSNSKKNRLFLFLSSCGVLWFTAGLFIPSALISSSAQEFSFIGDTGNPLGFVFSSFIKTGGFFIFWFPAMYLLFSDRGKSLLSLIITCLSFGSLLDVFAFTGSYGNISADLILSEAFRLNPEFLGSVLNILAIAAVFLVIFTLIAFDHARILTLANGFILSALFISGMINIYSINSDYKVLLSIIDKDKGTAVSGGRLESEFNLSKTGKNVVVIMLDRAINSFFPIAMEESPELAESYRGFIYYPNTVSYNGHTNLAAPPLFGGYEYTPEKINDRPDETLISKHNEALTVMPLMFARNGFRSKITDASWANYSWIPDNRIFNPYPGIKSGNLEGLYTNHYLKEKSESITNQKALDKGIKRNLLYFSLMRSAPIFTRFYIYKDGTWWESDKSNPEIHSFINKFAPLFYLPEITAIDEGNNSFICMVNNTTHDEVYLQYPDYLPVSNPDSFGPVFAGSTLVPFYHVNAASLKQLGKWFDYLRENGCYDNTRIIIVSDHGYNVHLEPFKGMEDKGFFYEFFNPLLVVKDFEADFPWKTDGSFMTNADVPFLASQNLLESPVNPFSGEPLSTDGKRGGVNIITNDIWQPENHSKNLFKFTDADIVTVKENIFDDKNWITSEERK